MAPAQRGTRSCSATVCHGRGREGCGRRPGGPDLLGRPPDPPGRGLLRETVNRLGLRVVGGDAQQRDLVRRPGRGVGGSRKKPTRGRKEPRQEQSPGCLGQRLTWRDQRSPAEVPRLRQTYGPRITPPPSRLTSGRTSSPSADPWTCTTGSKYDFHGACFPDGSSMWPRDDGPALQPPSERFVPGRQR